MENGDVPRGYHIAHTSRCQNQRPTGERGLSVWMADHPDVEQRRLAPGGVNESRSWRVTIYR